jgi:SAM-dependent methyltransferase
VRRYTLEKTCQVFVITNFGGKMTQRTIFQDKQYLRTRQYQDSSNLDARANLHRLYSTNNYGWQRWVFDQLGLQPGMRVLECGGGPGWLWRENIDRIPADCQITVSDFSEGMAAEAEAALSGSGHDFRFQTVNIEEIPFAGDSFDVVVANHMLYHVPNLAAALAEVRRVLRADGRFLAATNGTDHLREIAALNAQFAPAAAELEWPPLAFRLENGRTLLAPFFDTITLLPYEDSLEVTDAEPLLAYMQSMTLLAALGMDEETAVAQTNKLATFITQEIEERGAFHVTKATGLFIAK